MDNSGFEIERKWLISSFPDMAEASVSYMEQAYISFDPVTVRIRKSVNGQQSTYILCFKSGGGLRRRETEINLTKEQYDEISKHLQAPPVKKILKTYQLADGHILECNLVDEGEESSFYYAEVEFKSVDEANSFIPPAFLGKELTGKPEYSMAAYFRKKYAGEGFL